MHLPTLIQGTPQLALSTWPLARAVAQAGQLGVVSSAPLAVVLARRLQLGDFDGHLRRALEHFPFPGAARRVWEQFFVPGGKAADQPFELARQPTLDQGPALVELMLLANFTEVFLAKEAHPGAVGLHLHDEVRIPLLPSLYGAVLAGVDWVLIEGRHADALPAALDRLLLGQPAAVRVGLSGSSPEQGAPTGAPDVTPGPPTPSRSPPTGEGPPAPARADGLERVVSPDDASVRCGFDPAFLGEVPPPALKRPRLLVFVDSPEQAAASFLRAGGRIDAFLWECGAAIPSAIALDHMRSLGLPFWLGGLAPTRENLAAARPAGAVGLRVSAPFTFCEESALDRQLKLRVLSLLREDPASLRTAVFTAPAGPPLQVLRLDGTASDATVFADRQRLCDVGYFRQAYRRTDGTIGYRCPGEPLLHHVEKGGAPAAASRQLCLCNSLLASIGLGQLRSVGETERALVPSGEDLRHLEQFLTPDGTTFRAADVIGHLLAS
jgi:nitronate monooxygenase